MDGILRNQKYPLRRAHFVGTSVVVTIDPSHVRRLEIDDSTFFMEKPIENGIALEMYKLQSNEGKENRSLQPDELGGHSLVAATLTDTPSADDDAS